jgi:hypothetical protein
MTAAALLFVLPVTVYWLATTGVDFVRQVIGGRS